MEVQEAVKKAVKALKETFVDEELENLKLEEVEREDSGKAWYVTFGFDRAVEVSPLFSDQAIIKRTRVYKVVKLDSETGEAYSIKIREVTG